jgi:hypothetical protein
MLDKRQKISQALAGNENGKFNRRFRLNVSVFDNIDSEAKAYWLGFIMADGWVVIKPCYAFGLKLSRKDEEHVLLFRDFIESEHHVYYVGSDRQHCLLRITSKDFVLALIRRGVVPRKSQLLEYPNFVPTYLERHFIRGYFDGDGWITVNRNGLAFGIVGRPTFLRRIQKALIESCGLRETKLQFDKRHQGDTASLIYGGNVQCRRIYGYLYDGATVFLKRKEVVWNQT